MAVDESKQRVFWTDLVLNTVETVNWMGDRHKVVDRNNVSNTNLILGVRRRKMGIDFEKTIRTRGENGPEFPIRLTLAVSSCSVVLLPL